MCGRFLFESGSNKTLSALTEKANARLQSEIEKSYAFEEHEQEINRQRIKEGEVFPSDLILTLIGDGQSKVGAFGSQWGLNGRSLIINARGETLMKKKTFAPLFDKQRCVIPTSGFYEWQHQTSSKKSKDKYFFTVDESEPLYLAGLYQRQPNGLRSVIITREANESMLDFHHRMPLILRQDELRPWLFDKTFALEAVQEKMPLLRHQLVK
ncbi:SOS response-associated peptidase [Lactococcus fujiensis]|uniref:Abasic site processing protein n=1 Tax=Lactococcus fujiensis JCM 16395 TaxID=1291764 RepID=A0A2A5RJ28_9LACT|nr:SOS response-associated peptidase family protein [Lactococcus fujiensis]PCR99113.1 hypothetical protein RT41_GL000496 [Lactococcus fujiensis JCM 16395]